MKEYKNKLVIIGNGFDLAHGLKTSYNSFITWYIKDICKNMKEYENYDDVLVEVKFKDIKDIKDIKDTIYYKLLSSDEYRLEWFFEDNSDSIFYLERKSQFFKRLLIEIRDFSWVDVETEFYKSLLST